MSRKITHPDPEIGTASMDTLWHLVRQLKKEKEREMEMRVKEGPFGGLDLVSDT